MSIVGCWGTNELVECYFISFGYGARNDTAMLWLSLDAYKALSRLDDLPMSDYFSDISHDDYKKYSPMKRYLLSSDDIHCDDEEVKLHWFEEASKCRQYYEKNPDKVKERDHDLKIRARCYEMYDMSNHDYWVPCLGNPVPQDEENPECQEVIEKQKLDLEEMPTIIPGYDGKVSNYRLVNTIHESEEYQKKDILIMGGLRHHNGWLEQCCQKPINWVGGVPTKVEQFIDSNPNLRYKDPEMLNNWNWKKFLAASEWEKMNNWKGND